MDKSKTRYVKPKRKNYSLGHAINYEVSASKLSILQSWPFEKIYKTDCEVSPTSWELNVKFLEVKEDATVSLSVTLKRTDSEDTQPEGSVLVQICDSKASLLFPKQTFERERMLPGDVLHETVEISLLPDVVLEKYRSIVVHISITVGLCHGRSDPSPEGSSSNYSVEY